MKLAFDPSVISSKMLARLVGLFAIGQFVCNWPFESWGAKALLLGVCIWLYFTIASRQIWIVLHSPKDVLRQLQNTLQSTCIDYQVTDNSLLVTRTGTRASVRGIGPFSLVAFHVVDNTSNKERFLLEVMTKYLHFSGEDSDDG